MRYLGSRFTRPEFQFHYFLNFRGSEAEPGNLPESILRTRFRIVSAIRPEIQAYLIVEKRENLVYVSGIVRP